MDYPRRRKRVKTARTRHGSPSAEYARIAYLFPNFAAIGLTSGRRHDRQPTQVVVPSCRAGCPNARIDFHCIACPECHNAGDDGIVALKLN